LKTGSVLFKIMAINQEQCLDVIVLIFCDTLNPDYELQGKLIGICGPVGCGKSSLMTAILGRVSF